MLNPVLLPTLYVDCFREPLIHCRRLFLSGKVDPCNVEECIETTWTLFTKQLLLMLMQTYIVLTLVPADFQVFDHVLVM